MRSTLLLQLPAPGGCFLTDAEVWALIRERGFGHGRSGAIVNRAEANGESIETIRPALLAEASDLLAKLPREDRHDVGDALIAGAVLPGTGRSTGNVRFIVTRPSARDIRIYLFHDDLLVLLAGTERLIAELSREVAEHQSLALDGDVNVLEDRQRHTLVVGRAVGERWRERVRWAVGQTATPAPVAGVAAVIGGAVMAAASVTAIPLGLGPPLLGAAMLWGINVAIIAKRTAGIDWQLNYKPRREPPLRLAGRGGRRAA
jgi:hypothetical protein